MGPTLLVALIALLPPLRYGACVARRADQIAATVDRAQRDTGVPAEVLLVVGLLESSWGCHPASGGCWGAPIDARHRLTAGTADHAARALARSREVCGSWPAAIGRFRSGLCRPTDAVHRAYVRRAMALLTQLHARAGGVPSPWLDAQPARR